MAISDRSAPFRRAGSLLALLGLELAAVVGLHWLGRFSGLRIPWDRTVPWLLSSPLQEVLGAILRMVGLVMAYWLLASTLIYLVASLSRLPAALRALRWVTLPVVRRVADHAVAVTLATSMVGGGTVALAGPAGAAPSRGGGPSLGPPARGPVAAAPATGAAARRLLAQPTETSAGQPATSNWRPRTATKEPDTTADRPAPSKWRPRTATPAPESNAPQEPDGAAEPPREEGGAQPSSTTAPQAPSTTAPQAPSTTAPQAPSTTAPQTPSTTAPQAPGDAARAEGSASGDEQRSDSQEEPEWRPETAGNGTESGRSDDSTGPTPDERSRDQSSQPATQAEPYKVERGDNLWTIARDKLARDGSKSAGELTEKEIADYWVEVVKAFRDEFPSRDPNLIYTTDTIQLPPIGGSGS
jgi:hypothetical protein